MRSPARTPRSTRLPVSPLSATFTGFRCLDDQFPARGGSMRRAPVVGFILVLGGAVIVAQQSPAPASRDPQRELAMSIADGFTLAAVGDCIIARPVSQTPSFAPVAKIVHDADTAFGNFEGTAIDLARTPAVPQAEFGGVWIIGAPSVAKDLKAIGFDVMSRAN